MINHDKEPLYEVLKKLVLEAEQAALVVEGKKDKLALEQLGIKGDFFTISKSKGLHACAEAIAQTHKKAILLLDLDKKGKQLCRRMEILLTQIGVKINKKFGSELLKAANSCTVEGLRHA